MKNQIKDKIIELIDHYYDQLFTSIDIDPISIFFNKSIDFIITKFDIYHKLNKLNKWNISFSEFNEILEEDQELNRLLNLFLSNQLIHYSAGSKNKEIIGEYKDSIFVIEKSKIDIDFSNLEKFNLIWTKDKKDFSINTGENEDLEEEFEKTFLKDIEKY